MVDIEPIELRKQGATNRQVGNEIFNPLITVGGTLDGMHEVAEERASDLIEEYIDWGTRLYKQLLEAGVAKECARMILPMATSTTLYLNGSVRSWIHYLEQRTSQHAQKEHRDVAERIEHIFKLTFPSTAKALNL